MSAENEALARRFFEEFCKGRRAELAGEPVWDALGLVQQVGAVPAPA